ncbi:putative terpene synthase [Trifolium repens]|nr:putative terpene synthase [Trifolium repens]
MLANTMAVTDLRVSYLTNSLACFQTWSSTYQSRILFLQNSKSRIKYHKLSINNSIALNDKLEPLQTDDKIISLDQVKRRSKEALLNSSDPIRSLATSLQFRLLRHNGWSTCSDVFRKFLDKSGNFKESLTKDIKGMLSLHEASYLGTKDEEILKKAMEFSKAHLNDLRPYLSLEVSRNIDKALTLPKHLRMARLEARNYMEKYSK